MTDGRKEAAVRLRKAGHSVKSIARQLNAAQSSVSSWVRGIVLTQEQIQALRANTHSPVSIEKRRQSRLKSELAKRDAVISHARSMVRDISERELWLIGTALYWAEGGKTQSVVRFSNSDPTMIQLMLRFFGSICKVEKGKMRAHIHLHESLDVSAAETYWQQITGLSKQQFYKTYNKPNRSSKGTRNSLPYGVCDIYILDARLLLTIKGWTEGMCSSLAKTTGR